jgi:hypothetical protein
MVRDCAEHKDEAVMRFVECDIDRYLLPLPLHLPLHLHSSSCICLLTPLLLSLTLPHTSNTSSLHSTFSLSFFSFFPFRIIAPSRDELMERQDFLEGPNASR